MAKPPFAVEYHDDPKSKFRFKQETTDDEWLAKVSAEGWIVFSHDRKFHSLLTECSAVKQYKTACFYLPGAEAPTWDKMCCFIGAYEGMIERIKLTTKPFIFELSRKGRFKRISIP